MTRILLAILLPLGLTVAACADDEEAGDAGDTTTTTADVRGASQDRDDDGTQGAGDDATDTAEDAGESIGDAAGNAWASLRTNVERLIDRAGTGDDDARQELLEQCRDTLQELREADDPDADRLLGICDDIRDADDNEDWTNLREEFEAIDTNRG